MSRNPPNQKFSEWQQKARSSKSNTPARAPIESEELKLSCMVCDKAIGGFYARFGELGTCSGTCMKVQDKEPMYPGHSEEEFCKRFNL